MKNKKGGYNAKKRVKPVSKLDSSYYPWKCPHCKATTFKVTYVKNKTGGRLRRIQCDCGAKTYTAEKIIQPWGDPSPSLSQKVVL